MDMEMREDQETSGSGALEAYNICFGYVPAMVAKAVSELGIPNILATHPDEPMSALRITQLLSPPPSQPLHEAAQQLDRMMRFLCAYKVFRAHMESFPENPDELSAAGHVQISSSSNNIIKYSSTPVSRCLASLHPLSLLHMSTQAQVLWHHLSHSLLHGVPPFTAAHSMDLWALAASDPPFNNLFNSAMASSSSLSLLSLLQHYDGFQNGIHTLVDVGGGTGTAASTIAARYPSIRVINFDLHPVIATAPTYPGVQHVGGDMFDTIPPGDAIFLKWVLHDWDDKDCIKILDNCHKVLCGHGKLIIMEAVLDLTSRTGDSPFQNIRATLDMIIMSYTSGGKQRSQKQWEVLLGAAKFSIQRIIDLPCPECVIEAIPL